MQEKMRTITVQYLSNDAYNTFVAYIIREILMEKMEL